jgi:hypothetical protein
MNKIAVHVDLIAVLLSPCEALTVVTGHSSLYFRRRLRGRDDAENREN